MSEPIGNSNANQKIHVGNLPDSASEADVRALFTKHGPIVSYERPIDGPKKTPGWFTYVSMASADAAKAIAAVNGQMLGGQALSVSNARPRA